MTLADEMTTPDDRRRRDLERWARRLAVVLAADGDTQLAIFDLVARVGAGGMGEADLRSSIDELDDLIADCICLRDDEGD